MVGGGQGGFIGRVHRIAARFDDRFALVAGALSSNPVRARDSAAAWEIAPDRAYADWRAMAAAEAVRGDGIEAVVVVTPNESHHAICRMFLDAGIEVICEKPLATSLEQARDLVRAARGRVFGVTYGYTGYPMVREARAQIAAGVLGAVRMVQVEFTLGWLAHPLETSGNKQASWRTDPARAGPSGVVADIGTHAIHLAEFVSGLRLHAVAADLARIVPGRRVEDSANILLRFTSGARGIAWVSMVAAGVDVGLRLRVFGERGHLDWSQASANELKVAFADEPTRVLVRGGPGLSAEAKRASHIVGGLPEGIFEAFATLYHDFAEAIAAHRAGRTIDPLHSWYPTVEDGARGMAFVDAVLRSDAADGAWTELADMEREERA
jgi:predicted dehydrogenase